MIFIGHIVMTTTPRSTAYQVILWQLIVVAVLALGFLVSGGWHNAYSVLCGGVASVLPSFLYALALVSTTSTRKAGRIVITLFFGEFAKLIFSGALLVSMLLLLPVNLLPLFLGFFVAHLGFWIAPLTKNKGF